LYSDSKYLIIQFAREKERERRRGGGKGISVAGTAILNL
jgi:hypothetical protein